LQREGFGLAAIAWEPRRLISKGMRALYKENCLVLIPDGEDEASMSAAWKQASAGHVFQLSHSNGTQLEFVDLGPAEQACRVPINISSASPDPEMRLIGNFAQTSFEMDGQTYQSVESFWQGLKFEKASERRRLAAMSGRDARAAGQAKGYGKTISYDGREIDIGSIEHWLLMERACSAKFDQNRSAREALLATGERPLQHKMRRDSRAIPGVVMADIWMKIRSRLQKAAGLSGDPQS
jgi:predicted NAD-dependent protein-ADP-ribosyltransferase YbiA (DUF1768 family)